MRLSQLIIAGLSGASIVSGLNVPLEGRSASFELPEALKRSIPSANDLVKRKGGGGGGRGGGGSSSSSGSSGSSSGSRGGTSVSGSSSGTSNTGGRTSTGSGARPAYAGGRYYGGGAVTPYTAGRSTPRGLLALGLLPVAALGFLGAAWILSYPYGAYHYHYNQPWNYYNASSNRNESAPVTCLCGRYSTCGCEDNNDAEYIRSVIGDGRGYNNSLVNIAAANGTGAKTIYLNGDLPNGTTAAGGVDSAAFRSVSVPKGLAVWYGIVFLFVGTVFSTF